MKADNDQPKELSYCQTAALAVLRLKQQLQHEYEQAHPELRDVIPAILDQEEKNAWNLSSFPHLLVPDLVEARMAKLSLQTEGANDPAAATNAVHRIVTEYPNGFYTDRTVILAGQNLSRQGDPAGARKLFSEFLKIAPQPGLLPELQLAIARTYERENKWTDAIKEYEGWLVNFTNHEARPRAEYSRAHATFQAGAETNALAHFTNFVAHYPTNELTPRAQLWVADYYYRSGNPYEAEKNYQLLSLNWPGSELACQARMMAGRAAKERGSEDAKDYFAKLRDDTNCPTNLRFEALFALGDYWMDHSWIHWRELPSSRRVICVESLSRPGHSESSDKVQQIKPAVA